MKERTEGGDFFDFLIHHVYFLFTIISTNWFLQIFDFSQSDLWRSSFWPPPPLPPLVVFNRLKSDLLTRRTPAKHPTCKTDLTKMTSVKSSWNTFIKTLFSVKRNPARMAKIIPKSKLCLVISEWHIFVKISKIKRTKAKFIVFNVYMMKLKIWLLKFDTSLC